MKRNLLNNLEKWLEDDVRKPLVLRGARQVGKTTLVRQLAETSNRQLIELNFERTPDLASIFASNDPATILLLLASTLGMEIHPENSLLFLDEIQAKPELIAKLRWFYEHMPELPVVAAGSLLDFALEDHSFSMPVGRINYAYVHPFSFEEFLLAIGEDQALEFIQTVTLAIEIPSVLHHRLNELFKTYLIVGGMPEAVKVWRDTQNLTTLDATQTNLLATYRDDFSKYGGRFETRHLNEALLSIPKQLAQKFILSHISDGMMTPAAKKILYLLEKARLCKPVKCTHANGVPLGAEVNEKFTKQILLDVGLVSNLLGLRLDTLMHTHDLDLVNKGGIAEQVVGQLLQTTMPYYKDEDLFYWVREGKGRAAEIDYIVTRGSEVIPVEVKSGKTGSLKSLHLFMGLKNLDRALRFNSDFPSLTAVHTATALQQDARYTLISLPFYLIGQWQRLMDF